VWARRREALEPFQSGIAEIAASLSELGRELDVLATCVFDADGTREILFGPVGAAHAMPRGSIVMCHSTVPPQDIADIRARRGDRRAAANGGRHLHQWACSGRSSCW
jgi:3-hydroxyisobutyrate dehydrogenase-like beta-hydroxyacid dehydrogenase